jgi:hypothetical protein
MTSSQCPFRLSIFLQVYHLWKALTFFLHAPVQRLTVRQRPRLDRALEGDVSCSVVQLARVTVEPLGAQVRRKTHQVHSELTVDWSW